MAVKINRGKCIADGVRTQRAAARCGCKVYARLQYFANSLPPSETRRELLQFYLGPAGRAPRCSGHGQDSSKMYRALRTSAAGSELASHRWLRPLLVRAGDRRRIEQARIPAGI